MKNTFTGREMAAKMRDGKFDAVEVLATINTYNARNEKQGEAIGTRVEIPESTLMDRFGSTRIEIVRVEDNAAYVEIRA
jgi:hypothetical protein